MLHITRTDHYPIPADVYWSEVCLNLDFQQRMYLECLGCESVEVVKNEGDVKQGAERRLVFRKPIHAPAPIRKMFGDAVTMEESSRFDAQSQHYHFVFTPPMMGSRLRIAGSMHTSPSANGIDVITQTEFRCDVFGLGSLLERFAVTSAEESTAQKVRFTHDYIRARGLS